MDISPSHEIHNPLETVSHSRCFLNPLRAFEASFEGLMAFSSASVADRALTELYTNYKKIATYQRK